MFGGIVKPTCDFPLFFLDALAGEILITLWWENGTATDGSPPGPNSSKT